MVAVIMVMVMMSVVVIVVVIIALTVCCMFVVVSSVERIPLARDGLVVVVRGVAMAMMMSSLP